jgi:hypothetical protein
MPAAGDIPTDHSAVLTPAELVQRCWQDSRLVTDADVGLVQRC